MVLVTWNGLDWHGVRDALLTIAVLLPFVAGFSAIGLFVLMPLAILLIRHQAPFTQSLLAFVIVGAGLGWLMLFWLPLITATWLGAVAGAITAAIWVAANRGFFRRAKPA
jgi:hypothetical protein